MSGQEIKAGNAWRASILFSVLFTFLIWYLARNLKPFVDTLLPDRGATWYFWKLPVRDSTTMLFVWVFYLAHQIIVWGLIYWANRNLSGKPPSHTLTSYNVLMFAVNTVFMGVHLIQTQLFFDGLAQDVPIWTSQGSVILMLVFVLIIENRRRGLVLGRNIDVPLTSQVNGFFRRIHMVVVSWALVYTFWFHPMAGDPQLVSGFLYMFLLFTQMSMAWTEIHLKPSWIILLESYVGLHALIVAVYNTIQHGSADMWPMFFTGFTFMFVVTYQYGLNISRKANYLISFLYIFFLVWLYTPIPVGLGRGLEYLARLEFLWIPIILYLLALTFGLAVYAGIKLLGRTSSQ